MENSKDSHSKTPKEDNVLEDLESYQDLMDMPVCSATECTGLIPALPYDTAERKHYEELYPYEPEAKGAK